MTIDFKQLANSAISKLTPYQPGKPIEELERELGISSSIKLASNENPLGPSQKAIVAAERAFSKAHIYPDGGCYELKQALSRFLAVNANQLTIGNGSENILELIIKSYLSQGDSAVISQYAFLTIPILLDGYGVTTNRAAAKDWGHDIENMLSAIDNKTRVVFLVNPNNPTGSYTNKNDFEKLLQHVPPHILIVIDEAYSEYINIADYPKTLEYLNYFPNLIITRTFSKVYGLAALRLGYAVSSLTIADILNRARLPFNVNAIASAAACAALEDQEYVDRSIELNTRGLEQLQAGLHQLKLNFLPTIANFITVDVGDARTIYEKLLYEGVIVRPLHAYDMPKHIRVTVGTMEQNDRFIQAIKKVLSC